MFSHSKVEPVHTDLTSAISRYRLLVCFKHIISVVHDGITHKNQQVVLMGINTPCNTL